MIAICFFGSEPRKVELKRIGGSNGVESLFYIYDVRYGLTLNISKLSPGIVIPTFT
jgi:hypothetical protein